MKKLMALVLAAILLASMICVATAEDEISFAISNIKYDGKTLTAVVNGEVPAGKRVAVYVTLFMPNNTYIRVPTTIIDGELEMQYSEAAEYITLLPFTFTRLSDVSSRAYYYGSAVEYFVQ